MMKIRHKKIVASGTAVALAGILGVGALLQSSISVQASPAMMPGIEQIVNDTTAEKPFKILEIVDDTSEAEIGYYVSGQEPYVKLYSYTYKYKENNEEKEKTIKFKTLEEGLKKLPTDELRKEFATNMNTGIKNIQSSSYQAGSADSEENYPLSYSNYQEKYFLSDSDDPEKWQKINFQKIDGSGNSRTDTVKIKGNYRENTAGTGDYTKQEQQYYPIRQDDNDDKAKPEKYRENIQNFYYADNNTADAPYFLEFQEVDNNTVNQAFDTNHNKINNNSILKEYDYSKGNYGYYENVYSDLTAEIVQNIQKGNYTFPGENPALSSDDENLAVKIPDSTNTRAVNAKSFSDGNDEFSSINEADADNTVDANTQADTQPDVSSDGGQASQPAASSSADAFSTGDFSDGISDSADGNIENSDISQAQAADTASADTDFNSVTDAGTDFSADANAAAQADADPAQNAASVENDKITPIINYSQTIKKDADGNDIIDANGNKATEEDPSIGTSANPKVYYGVTIDQYPYYKYTLISDMNKIVASANANADAVQNGTFTPTQATTSGEREKNITFQDNQYWYWTVDENGNTVKNPISIVTQRQPVSYEDIREIPTTLGYNYYYKVSQAYFCCKKSASSEDSSTGTGEQLPYRYFGWYVPSYPQNQDVYIPVVENDRKTATHYISDAEYKLTPGTGNYDFVPDDTAPEQTVEVDHMYYQGGYTNHDWFKRYVFHLDPGEEGSDERKQFDGFKIEVETMTLQEFNSMYGSSGKTTSETQSDDTSGVPAAETNQDINAAQSEEQSENQTEDQTTEQSEAQTVSRNEGDTSEVDQMVSEAGVELVSIEKELAETTDGSTSTDEFQDGTSVDSQATEDSAQTTNNISDTSSQISDETDTDAQFTDNSADAIDDDGAFSAGDTATSNTSGKLAEYGLIYVNSSGINQAAAKEMSNIPTIINAAKLTDNSTTGDSTTAQSFTAYIKGTDQDADGHYVNTLVYVFKNTFAETNESTHQSDLINVNFHTNFNQDDVADDSGSTASNAAIQGFEEILEYIESENKYRKLGQTTDSSGISDGSDEVSDGETVTPTPANAKIPLLKKDISQARAIEYIINYNLKRALNTKKSIRVLEIEPAKISDNNKNRLTSDKVSEWLGISVPEIESSEVCCTGPHDSEKIKNMFDGKDNDNIWHSNYYAHDKNFNNGHHYIKLTLKKPASLSGFNYKPRTKSRNGKIVTFQVVLTFENEKTHIETGEFKYNNIDTDTTLKKFRFADDKVYQNVKGIQINIITAGNNTGNKDNNAQFASCSELSLVSGIEVTVDAMTAAEFVGHTDDIGSKYDMIYIGDQKNNDQDTDLLTGSGEMCYAHVGATRNTGLGSVNLNLLKLIGQLDKDYQDNNPNAEYFAAIETYSESGAGYFRGSGNDITPQICSELKEFVQSGYPVVFASGLMKQNQDNKSRVIDNKKVDASSYYYEFMSYALKYDNVFVSSELNDRTDKLTFFSNLAKPVIKFTSKPPEPPRANDSSNVSNRALIQDGQLKYVFSIENDSDAAPAVTTYDCNLYLDLNFDGNLSEKEDQSAYIQIADSSGQVLSRIQDSDGKNHYHLRAGQKYTLTRKLPESYYKIITWKLEISSNRNSYIHTSENGYAKQGRKEGAEPQTIKVLQLLPENGGGNWDLSLESGLFQTKLKQLKKDKKINFDFDIKVTTTTVNAINAYTNQHEFRDVLNGSGIGNGYDILIIGFADVYSNINNNYNQVDDILDFIKSGKSVIFSHDTTSYINYNETVKDLRVYVKSDHSGTRQYYSIIRQNNWGLYLNKLLRSVVGMDRYGITLNEDIPGTKQKASDLLRKGNELKDGESVSFKSLMELAGDVAYKNGTRSQSYAQTQGYSNRYMSNNFYIETTSADKVNDGAITQYPYVIGDKIRIGTTHSQYYQLGLEQDRDINGNADGKSDVVVWYTLAGGKYDNSPRDARNQYYFYSKGNVIYTGAGHKKVGDCEEEVNLFINAITAAANVTAVEPKASFVKGMNPNAGVETTKYYMTDQTTWNDEQNVVNNDIDLYLNIKEYNMVSADLSQSDLDKQEMTIKFYIENENGTEQTDGPEDVKLKDITDEINTIWKYGGSKDGIKVSNDKMFHTKNSSVYSLKLSGVEAYLKKTEENGTKTYKNNCKVYAKVSSTVYLYGKANTRTVWTSINLKQRQLFDLD